MHLLLASVALFGHADGFSWDEALMVLAPIALLAGVLLYANQKVQRRFGPEDGVTGPPGHTASTDAEPDPAAVAEPANPTDPT